MNLTAISYRRRVLLALFIVSYSLTISPLAHADRKGAKAEGAHILTWVIEVASRETTMATGEDGVLGSLHAHGITDDEITDGSVAAGIVYCCGSKVAADTAVIFYVPPDFRIAVDDVVELVVGGPANKKRKTAGTMMRAVRVREADETTVRTCRWDPEDDRLWMRIIYCDWMPDEGWKYQRGMSKTWYKPPPADN